MYRIYLFFFLFLVGCGAALRPDPVPVTSYDANYPAGEGIACGAVFNGLSICPLNAGDPLSKINLSFAGYYNGTIKVDSNICNIHDSFTYKGSGLIPYKLPGIAAKSCEIDFVLAHAFPNEQNSGLEISPLKGRIWVTVGDLPKTFYQMDKLSEGIDASLTIPVTSPTIKLSFRACGVTYDQTVNTSNGMYTVKLSDIGAPLVSGTRCALTGAVFDGRGVYMIRWMYWSYRNDFAPLPRPQMDLVKGKLTMTADTAVSFIGLDTNQKISNRASYTFDSTKSHIARFLSVKGRMLLAVWDVAAGEWTWIQ